MAGKLITYPVNAIGLINKYTIETIKKEQTEYTLNFLYLLADMAKRNIIKGKACDEDFNTPMQMILNREVPIEDMMDILLTEVNMPEAEDGHDCSDS